MPQIRSRSLALALISGLLCLGLAACGDVNPQANLNSDTGKHVPNWLPDGHKAAALADINGCTECHGSALDGGIAKVSCLQCHMGSATSVHPVIWGNLAYTLHSGYVTGNGTTSCATDLCHGTALTGVAGSGPACLLNCHMAGTAQAPQIHQWGAASATTAADIAGHKNYFENVISRNDYTSCRNAACHGGALQGAFASGPSCIRNGCHSAGPGNPLPAEN